MTALGHGNKEVWWGGCEGCTKGGGTKKKDKGFFVFCPVRTGPGKSPKRGKNRPWGGWEKPPGEASWQRKEPFGVFFFLGCRFRGGAGK